MKAIGTFNSHYWHHWHFKPQLAHHYNENMALVTKLYAVRLLALVLATALWVITTLSTGSFSVLPIILIGIGVGSAHHLMKTKRVNAHLTNALTLTLGGGVVANVFAGLAEFSRNMGVDYLQVLMGRELPRDFVMLKNAFVSAFQIQDLMYYALAIIMTILLTLNSTETGSSKHSHGG